jgi:hypothetical protein
MTNPITNGVSFSAIARTTRLTFKTRAINEALPQRHPAFEAPDVSGTYLCKAKKKALRTYNES